LTTCGRRSGLRRRQEEAVGGARDDDGSRVDHDVSQALQSSSGSASSSIDNEVNAFKALANAAPSEIRGDFETFATAFAAYAQALAKTGFKPGKVPTAGQIAAMTAAAKSFSTPKLQAAEQHLSAWAQQNCGAPKTTTG
jgi:hypothetical protein